MKKLTRKLHKTRYTAIILITALGLGGVLLLTSPNEHNQLITLLPLVLVWVLFFSIVQLLFVAFADRVSGVWTTISMVIASTGTLLLLFSALGQLSSFDVVLLIALAAVGTFYLRRTWLN